MGTRSLTIITDESWDTTKELCVMYRQFDGYCSGHGKELHAFLKGMAIINGIPGNPPPKFANGMSCLAAQLIAHFKRDAAGGYYLHAAGTRDCGDEYRYFVSGKFHEPLKLRVESYDGVIYEGPLDSFNPDCEKEAA